MLSARFGLIPPPKQWSFQRPQKETPGELLKFPSLHKAVDLIVVHFPSACDASPATF